MLHNFLQSDRCRELDRRFQALKAEVAQLGWLTQGSVVPNHPGNWRWTRKVNAKTVSVSLSPEQAEVFREAIANHRKLESIVDEMRLISQEVLLNSVSGFRKKTKSKNHPKSSLS